MLIIKEYKNLNKILGKDHEIIIYAESQHYYVYFSFIINQLIQSGVTITYITSDPHDPVLKSSHDNLHAYYLKFMIGYVSSRLKARFLLMTMTELELHYFKRSPDVKQYIYVFHAPVSTHLQYEKHSFDHYDAIFCIGNYHIQEIRATEKLYSLPPKELINFGYPLFSELNKSIPIVSDMIDPVILLAPSWFKGCIFDVCFEDLISQLAATHYRVIIKPHPEFFKRFTNKVNRLFDIVRFHHNVSIDTESSLIDLLVSADFLITDRSGIAFEYAFGLERPVLFIDTDMKIMNQDWREISLQPIENSLREKMGVTLMISELNQLNQKINELNKMKKTFSLGISKLRESEFFNSYEKGIRYLTDDTK
jgi:YidC/Oxa1 family membrane protein insertase